VFVPNFRFKAQQAILGARHNLRTSRGCVERRRSPPLAHRGP
jgi:hypothetical protein